MTDKLANAIETGALSICIPLTLIAIGVSNGFAQYFMAIFGVLFIYTIFQNLTRLSKEAKLISSANNKSE